MDPHRDLSALSARLNALQSAIEAMIADQLDFRRDGQHLTLQQEMDCQAAACEAVERWAETKSDNLDLAPVTPLQHLLEEFLEATQAERDALAVAGIRS